MENTRFGDCTDPSPKARRLGCVRRFSFLRTMRLRMRWHSRSARILPPRQAPRALSASARGGPPPKKNGRHVLHLVCLSGAHGWAGCPGGGSGGRAGGRLAGRLRPRPAPAAGRAAGPTASDGKATGPTWRRGTHAHCVHCALFMPRTCRSTLVPQAALRPCVATAPSARWAPRGGATHLPIGPPPRERHSSMRCAKDGTRFSAPGYRPQTAVTRFLNVSKVSAFASSLRTCGLAQPQTFSCGFKSGECAGQCGKARKPHDRMAARASSVCMSVSPSRRMVQRLRRGSVSCMKGRAACARNESTSAQ